jgi:hypothetical protein
MAGCGLGDVIDLARDPSPCHIAWYLLLAPILWVLDELFGEFIRAVIPERLKTRRVLWGGVVVVTIATILAFVYWSTAAPH